MTDTLSTLETDLETLAKPAVAGGSGKNADDWESGTATPTILLKTIADLLTALTGIGVIGPAIKAMKDGIGGVLPDVANALNKIAEAVETIEKQLPKGSTPDQIMQALSNGLSLAQSLSPNQNPALASGSQLFNNLSQLLAKKNANDAAMTLFKIAQQLKTIGGAL